MFSAVRILTWCTCALLVTACGSPSRGPGDTSVAATTNQHDAPPNTGDLSRVYAHSGTTLYRIDTHTFAPQMIGNMTGLGTQSLTDLAVDKDDHMVGITLDKLYAIDATTGTVTLVKDLSQSANGFTSLSYVPADLNDPGSADLLVSANDQGDVYQIDASTGTAAKIGSYATVNVGTEATDYLAKIDPVTWKATPLGAGTGFSHIFGLGYWAGTFYGFIDAGAGAGKMVTIDQNTGAGTLINAGVQRWYGAGVTTDAPILQ